MRLCLFGALLVLASCTAAGSPASQAQPDWKTYRSDRWGYTIGYPATWYLLDNHGAPVNETYIANESDIGAPLEMHQAGVFFALTVRDGDCTSRVAGKPDRSAQIRVNGQTITRDSGFFGPAQSEAFWASDASLHNGSRCFDFEAMFGSKKSRDANLPTTDRMIESFRTS